MATKLPYVLPFEDGSVVAAILLKAQGLPETEQIATKTELQQATAYLATLDNATMAPQSATVKRTTDNLQAQIDNIVRAPESGGDVGAEVYQARVGADGTNYQTLKNRLDAEYTNQQEDIEAQATDVLQLREQVFNPDNLVFFAKKIVVGAYYVNGETASEPHSYAVIPVKGGVTYVLGWARFLAYATGPAIQEFVHAGSTFTPDSDADLYITFSNDLEQRGEWYIYEQGRDGSKIGTYQHPGLAESILTYVLGDSDHSAISQKAVTDAIGVLQSELDNLDVNSLTGYKFKDYTDMSSAVIDSGTGGYWSASAIGTLPTYTANDNYRWVKLPIDKVGTYVFNRLGRMLLGLDSDGKTTVFKNANYKYLTVPDSTAYLLLSYSVEGDSLKIAHATVPDDQLAEPVDSIKLLPATIRTADFTDTTTKLDWLLSSGNDKNIFATCLIRPDCSYYGGVWSTTGAYATYSVLMFYATEGVTYKFGCMIRFFTAESGDIGTYIPVGYEYTAPRSEWLYCSVSKAHQDTWKCVALPNSLDEVNPRGSYTFNPNILAQEPGNSETKLMSQKAITNLLGGDLAKQLYGTGFYQESGNLASGDSFRLPKTNAKKNQVYSFVCAITQFNAIELGHGKNHYSDTWVRITATNVEIHKYYTSESTQTLSHGLTISDYLYVQITVKAGTAVVRLYSNGAEYVSSEVSWDGYGLGDCFVTSDGSTLTDCVFTWSSEDFRKATWMFGDSYFGMDSTARWVHYLMDAGYGDNVLLNAYPGENTTNALTALNNSIAYYGAPRFLIWCLGMNDGTDSNPQTPSTTWLNGITQIIALCAANNITLILATIPSVPNINHEGKNNYVRTSGYRYIDFAKAVGASSNGTWYSGMLSSDNVHPTATGALALYYRAIADAPEITFTNP